jgi:putative hemolysin
VQPLDVPEALRFQLDEGRYLVRLAMTASEVLTAQRLRFEVFTKELGEGLAHNLELGLDRDAYDEHCHHLLLIDRQTEQVVGTYRLQSAAMARAGAGFYCDDEYELAHLPDDVLDHSVELGRACILANHRQGTSLYALWRGLARYLVASRSRYLFGCCSITSIDPRVGLIADQWLEQRGKRHASLRVPARETHRCAGDPPRDQELASFALPKLFGSYLRYGAQVASEPALDLEFGTVDFLVLFDLAQLEPRLKALFFEA